MKYRLYCPRGVGDPLFFFGGGEEWLFSPDNIPEGTFAVGMMP